MNHLIALQLRIIRNKFKKLSFTDEIKAALFLLMGLIFFAGIYSGAWRLLSYMNDVPLIGNLLVNKLLALVFLTSFSMVILSSLITSFNTIFSGRDLPWLMVTPLSLRTIFTFKALNTFFYSSWMVLFALLPFIIALGQIKGVSPLFYLWTLLLMMPFFLISSLVGVVISLLLMRYFPSHRTRDMLLLLSIILITGVYILGRFLQPEKLVKPDGLEIVAQYLSYLDAPTAVFLPSWWIAAGIYSLISGQASEILFYSGLLSGSAAAALILTVALAERIFYTGWAEGHIYHKRKSPSKMDIAHSKRGPLKAVFEKDISIFFRDTNQWSQLLLLGGLVIVYLFSIYKLPLETMYLQNLVSFFNVGLIGFILSAVSLRFVFPLISLEGDTFWILRSSPLAMGKLLIEKSLFGIVPVASMGIILVIASNLILKADWPICWISLSAIIIVAAGMNSLAIGLGAIFPVFGSNSVAQIESSPGGLFYIVTAIFYLGVNISLWAWPVQNIYQHKFGGASVPWSSFLWVGIGLFCFNLAACVLPFIFGLRSLRELEL